MRSLQYELGHRTAEGSYEGGWRPALVAWSSKDVTHYFKTCNTCQRMICLPWYTTWAYIPHSSLFELVSINFACPFPATTSRIGFLLVNVEHLTGWPIMEATKRATAGIVLELMSEKRFPFFGSPRAVGSNNAACFTANVLQKFIKEEGTEWPWWFHIFQCPMDRLSG